MMSLKGYMKDRVMRNLFKLKDARSSIFRSVGVTHDMTREEREKNKELKEEAKKKNNAEKDSGNYYVIRKSIEQIYTEDEEEGNKWDEGGQQQATARGTRNSRGNNGSAKRY